MRVHAGGLAAPKRGAEHRQGGTKFSSGGGRPWGQQTSESRKAGAICCNGW
jgi:hypothetical protein